MLCPFGQLGAAGPAGQQRAKLQGPKEAPERLSLRSCLWDLQPCIYSDGKRMVTHILYSMAISCTCRCEVQQH